MGIANTNFGDIKSSSLKNRIKNGITASFSEIFTFKTKVFSLSYSRQQNYSSTCYNTCDFSLV